MSTRHDAHPKALAAGRRKAATRHGSGLTKRVEKALGHLIDGDVETMKAAAEKAGLTDRALRLALKKPAVLAHYRSELAALREGERVANLRALTGIRDDPSMKSSPAGQKVRVDAVRAMEPQPEGRGGVQVNVGLGVNVTLPGYVVDLGGVDPASMGEILRNAGSVRTVFDAEPVEVEEGPDQAA